MEARRSWSRRNWPLLVPPIVVGLAVLIGWFVNTSLFLVMPGEAVDTTSMVSVQGHQAKKGAGQLYLMTVYSSPANLDEWVFGHVYPHAQLVPANTQLPPNTTYQRFRHIEEAMMTDSQTTAKVVALRELGYTIPEHGQGAVVDSVEPGSAAAKGGVQKGDLIQAINGQPIQTAQQLIEAIGAFHPGQQVRLELEPNNSNDTSHTEVTLGAHPGQPAQPLLGVVPMTYHPTYDFPVQINIDSRGIIGPSGGLILTLSIMQALSATDITHGHPIAATGTIDLQGNVGPIGDVQDKVIAAEGHADYFLVPKADYDAAKAQAKRIQVVEIDTIDQAKSFLAGLAPRK